MSAAARVLQWALSGLHDEALLLLKANLIWFLLSLPIGLPLFILVAGLVHLVGVDQTATGLLLPLLIAGFVVLLVPGPASLGIYGLAATMSRKESPPLRQLWVDTRQGLQLGASLAAIGIGGLLVLVVNVFFYLRAEQALVQAFSVVWVYLTLFWLALQLYLGPVVMLLGERRLLAVYRRSAMLVLAQPTASVFLLVVLAVLLLLCVFVPPLFPAAMSVLALAATGAVAELKRKYDPENEPDGEPA